jgi:hypothetical protein
MDKRNLFERTKKGSANVQCFMEASFMPGRMIVNKIKARRFTLAGRDDGMCASYSRGRWWSRPGLDDWHRAFFAVGMIGKHICCTAICKPNWAVLGAANVRAATEGWSKAYLLQISNVEGAKAHDDFTSSILGHDVILDAKRGLAGVFDLGEMELVSRRAAVDRCMTPNRVRSQVSL